MWVNYLLDRVLEPGAPPIDRIQALLQSWSIIIWPPCASRNSLDDGLQVHFWVKLDFGLQVNLWVTQSQPPHASPNPLDHNLEVHLWGTPLPARNTSPNSFDHGLQVHLWVQLHLGRQVHLQTRSIMASKCISDFTRLSPSSESPNPTDHYLQVCLTSHQQNVFQSLGASRSVWEDVECKLRCVNFRRVSDCRRAFRPAFGVTEISVD